MSTTLQLQQMEEVRSKLQQRALELSHELLQFREKNPPPKRPLNTPSISPPRSTKRFNFTTCPSEHQNNTKRSNSHPFPNNLKAISSLFTENVPSSNIVSKSSLASRIIVTCPKNPNTIDNLLQRFRTEEMRALVKRHYLLLSEAQLQDEAQHIEHKQAEAVEFLQAEPGMRVFLKDYQQLYPGIKGGIGMEEIHSKNTLIAVITVVNTAHKSALAALDQQLALQATTAQAALSPSPAITNIFRDATIYDSNETRWIVRGIVEEAGEKRIDIESNRGELASISTDQLKDFTRFRSKYHFRALVDKQTDIDVWKAKSVAQFQTRRQQSQIQGSGTQHSYFRVLP